MNLPEKPKKRGSKSVNISKKNSWQRIIKEVDKKEIPIHVIERLTVILKDGSEVPINIKELLSAGADPDEVEKELNSKLEKIEAYIENVNYYLDIDAGTNNVAGRTAIFESSELQLGHVDKGDLLNIKGVDYHIIVIKPDNCGWVSLLLERQ